MTINSNNYEEYFLLYVDNELDATLRAEVEVFAAQHPGLQKQLDTLQQTKLFPGEEVLFENKKLLYRQENPGPVTTENYETFFLLYADNELPEEQRAAVESFVAANPEKRQEWILLQRTKLQADDSIKFPDKQKLYRYEKKPARIIPIAWIRVAAAAIVITGGLLWLYTTDKNGLTDEVPQQVAVAGPHITPQQNPSQAIMAPGGENVSGTAKMVAEPNTGQAIHTNHIDQKNEPKTTAIKVTRAEEIEPVADTRTTLQDPPVTSLQEPVQAPLIARSETRSAPLPGEEIKMVSDLSSSPVKPLILDAAAFSGDRDIRDVEKQETGSAHYLSINDDDKKAKGKLRGLFRKVSRIIDRATNAEPEDGKSIVRIASFEIAKK